MTTSLLNVLVCALSCTCLLATQPTKPDWTQPPTKGLLSADDVAYLQTAFANPQCAVFNMTHVYISPTQYSGRWWGILGAGSGTEQTKSFLLDMYQQEDPTLLILREVSNSNGVCTENYFSKQYAFINGQHYWQKTVNYTVDQKALRWGQAGRTFSVWFKILYTNANLMVQYFCLAPNLDGTCPAGSAFLYVNSRTQTTVCDSDLQALNILLNYTCLSNFGYSFNKVDPTDSCVADYVTRTSMYHVQTDCDYTNIGWMQEHSTVTDYNNLVQNPNWQSIDGDWFGQVTTINFTEPYASEGKLFMVMYRQQTNDSASCVPLETVTWLVNNTGRTDEHELAEPIPGFFPTTNFWILAFNVSNGVSSPSNVMFWRLADDGTISATLSSIGPLPCRNASCAVPAGSRRYRKLSAFIFRVRLYPTYALACLDPSALGNVKAVRSPALSCGDFADTKTCLNCDLVNHIYKGWKLPVEKSIWVLTYTLSTTPWKAMACQFEPHPTAPCFTCYYNLYDQCYGPWKTNILSQEPAGNMTWEYTDPSLGLIDENLIIVYHTTNIMAFYGCAFNGQDLDGSCRDDRMLAYVFVQSGYTLTAADNAAIQKSYDQVCLFTISQLFSLNTADTCFKPLGI